MAAAICDYIGTNDAKLPENSIRVRVKHLRTSAGHDSSGLDAFELCLNTPCRHASEGQLLSRCYALSRDIRLSGEAVGHVAGIWIKEPRIHRTDAATEYGVRSAREQGDSLPLCEPTHVPHESSRRPRTTFTTYDATPRLGRREMLYSVRKTTIGSVRAARLAGDQQAIKATSTRRAALAANDIGS